MYEVIIIIGYDVTQYDAAISLLLLVLYVLAINQLHNPHPCCHKHPFVPAINVHLMEHKGMDLYRICSVI
jgi:hypothetical protein